MAGNMPRPTIDTFLTVAHIAPNYQADYSILLHEYGTLNDSLERMFERVHDPNVATLWQWRDGGRLTDPKEVVRLYWEIKEGMERICELSGFTLSFLRLTKDTAPLSKKEAPEGASSEQMIWHALFYDWEPSTVSRPPRPVLAPTRAAQTVPALYGKWSDKPFNPRATGIPTGEQNPGHHWIYTDSAGNPLDNREARLPETNPSDDDSTGGDSPADIPSDADSTAGDSPADDPSDDESTGDDSLAYSPSDDESEGGDSPADIPSDDDSTGGDSPADDPSDDESTGGDSPADIPSGDESEGGDSPPDIPSGDESEGGDSPAYIPSGDESTGGDSPADDEAGCANSQQLVSFLELITGYPYSQHQIGRSAQVTSIYNKHTGQVTWEQPDLIPTSATTETKKRKWGSGNGGSYGAAEDSDIDMDGSHSPATKRQKREDGQSSSDTARGRGGGPVVSAMHTTPSIEGPPTGLRRSGRLRGPKPAASSANDAVPVETVEPHLAATPRSRGRPTFRRTIEPAEVESRPEPATPRGPYSRFIRMTNEAANNIGEGMVADSDQLER